MKVKKALSFCSIILCVMLADPMAAHAARYTGDQFRDPFGDYAKPEPSQEAVLEKPVAPSEFIFGGVIWVPGKPRALINGRRVLEGGEVDGAKVVEIRKKEVTILLNGQEMVLRTRNEETS